MTEQQIRDQFFQTLDAPQAIAGRTHLVDELVRKHWSSMPPDTALLAVGGYGRSELFPFSDIDLLILTRDEKTQFDIREPLSLVLRDLWDAGLRISQSVRTPADCNQIDAGNAELAVSLLDRRLLAGDEALFRQIRDPKPELGRNIVELTRSRHSQFQNTIYHLEPHVKDSPGGLRDLQVLRWLSRLGAGDQDLFGDGVPVLFQIRCFLHYLAGRDDNKFTFERQDEIARLCGAATPEDLMRQYYRAVRGIARLAGRRLERFEAKRSSLFAQFRDRTSRLSNSEFSVLHGAVFFRSPQALEANPGLILQLFDFVGRHGLPLAPDTEERVERQIPAFRVWVETHQPVWPPFRAILRLPHGARALRAMHETHVLEAIFPELLLIDAFVIRDFYHRYTVDEHTLVAIETVMNLRERQSGAFSELAGETNDLDLLVTALIFHDVGKALEGEDHTVSSPRIATEALTRCGISERALGVVCFLISAHLELSATMNGRDISDPATIQEVAAKTATVERLKLLTLLTFGDISAVNPGALTPWRRQLLWGLYSDTHAELTRELTDHSTAPQTHAGPEMNRLLEGLPPRYLRTHSEAEMTAHLALAREAREKGVAVSLVREEAWMLTVVAVDRPALFACVAGTVAGFGFNILKAEAFSNAHGIVIDTFAFADTGRSLELNPDEVRNVTNTIVRAVLGEVSVEQLLARRPRVKPDAYALSKSRVVFDNHSSSAATLVELVTQDRPGLLYDVASLISRRAANIEVVLVDTEAKKALDVFYLTKAGRKLTDEEAGEITAGLAEIARGT